MRASQDFTPASKPSSDMACPLCHSTESISIAYGDPTLEMRERAARGEVALGGGVLDMRFPDRQCRRCGWRRLGDGPAHPAPFSLGPDLDGEEVMISHLDEVRDCLWDEGEGDEVWIEVEFPGGRPSCTIRSEHLTEEGAFIARRNFP